MWTCIQVELEATLARSTVATDYIPASSYHCYLSTFQRILWQGIKISGSISQCSKSFLEDLLSFPSVVCPCCCLAWLDMWGIWGIISDQNFKANEIGSTDVLHLKRNLEWPKTHTAYFEKASFIAFKTSAEGLQKQFQQQQSSATPLRN